MTPTDTEEGGARACPDSFHAPPDQPTPDSPQGEGRRQCGECGAHISSFTRRCHDPIHLQQQIDSLRAALRAIEHRGHDADCPVIPGHRPCTCAVGLARTALSTTENPEEQDAAA